MCRNQEKAGLDSRWLSANDKHHIDKPHCYGACNNDLMSCIDASGNLGERNGPVGGEVCYAELALL